MEIAQNVVDYLQISLNHIKFFTDSKVTLGYICNNKKRFYVYVANRVAKIRSYSEPSQWQFVRSEMNPADKETRGIHPIDLQRSAWLRGPSDNDSHTSSNTSDYQLVQPEDDVEIRASKSEIQEVKPSRGLGSKVFEKFSDWNKLISALATIRRKIQYYISAKCQDDSKNMDNV